MKEILETIIMNLVADPKSVSINEIVGETAVIYEVKVAENDMGKIIGKQGKLARSIRSIMKAIADKEKKRVTIEFIG